MSFLSDHWSPKYLNPQPVLIEKVTFEMLECRMRTITKILCLSDRTRDVWVWWLKEAYNTVEKLCDQATFKLVVRLITKFLIVFVFQQKIIKPTKFDFATWSWSYPIIYFPWHDTMPHRSMWHLKYVISLRQIPAKSSVSQTLIRKCLTLPLFCLQVAHGTDCKRTIDCVGSFEKSMMKATNFTWTGHMIVILLWLTG